MSTIKISKSRIDLGMNRLDNALLKDCGEVRTTPSISSGTLTLDLSTGNVFEVSLNANITTLSITNPIATGTAQSFTLVFTADGTARTVAWGSAVSWPSGTAPTLTSTSGQRDFLSFYTSTAGTTWQGFVVGQNFAPITSPTNTVAPTVSGVANVGDTLTASSGTWTGSPASFTYTYQWQHGTTNIGGATSITYVVQSAYIGETIRVQVTASNGVVPDGVAYSSATATVTNITWVENVFSAYIYTGTGATQTITTGIQADLIHIKDRSDNTSSHALFDSTNGATKYLACDSTAALVTDASTLTSITSTGFALGANGTGTSVNKNTDSHIAWSYKESASFFKKTQATVSGGVSATVDLSSLGTVGMVWVKRSDSTGSWFAWHRSLPAGQLKYVDTGGGKATDASISVSGTTLTLTGGTIANGTYTVYAWAHDTSANGLVQCGTYTTDASNHATVTLGWEPQLLITACFDAGQNWQCFDTMRGWSIVGKTYEIDLDTVTADYNGNTLGNPTATGFYVGTAGASQSYMYMAIRRGPMKLPALGTQVYNAVAFTGTGANSKVTTGVGFPPDLVIQSTRNAAGDGHGISDRLRGGSTPMETQSTAAESSYATSYYVKTFDMDGVTDGTTSSSKYDASAQTKVFHFLRRHSGVFDEVCFTVDGTGNATFSHNLVATPELIITKGRSGINGWYTYHSSLAANTKYLNLNSTGAWSTAGSAVWNSVTSTSVSVSNFDNNFTEVAYLFATLAGVSKVGSYTGDGTTGRVINCGFTTGARFIMIKVTSTTGDWFVYDTTRTYPAGNDYHLSLNTTAAEVVTTDDVDADNSGFIVNQNATTNLNVDTATYIYLAFA